MKDRIDVDGFGFNAVEDHVGELLDDCSSRVFRNELKCFWTAPDGPQALFHALKKHVAQARLLLLVPLVGLLDITFRRWQQRYEESGEAGLLDRRLGRASGKRVPVDREAAVEALYRTRYSGFTARHFHEHLVRDHQFTWGYTWTKAFLQSKGLLARAPRRGAHRRKRPRRPLPGMMLHQDGSRHEWLAGCAALDLIVTMDDATNVIYSAFLVAEEGTESTFQALLEVFSEHGLPLSLYTDRGSHYFVTPEAGGPVDRRRLTQVGRALAHLGVEHIAAYSPQARGRSERLFQTLQDRLVKELALAGITTVAAANQFIREVYIPAHNVRFAVKAEQEGSAFVAIPGVDLREILCIQEERQVDRDNTVSYRRLKLQIPPSPLRAHFVKARVKVRQYHDGSHAIFHGPDAWAAMTRTGRCRPRRWPRRHEPLRSIRLWICGQRKGVAHNSPGASAG